MFLKYPKTKTLFKLVPKNSKGSKWSCTSGEILPETAPLHYFPIEDLIFTEKIDGVNMGISMSPSGTLCEVQKKNEVASYGCDKYYMEIGEYISSNIIDKNEIFPILQNIIIYGELCGPKIQKGGNYFQERKFLVFDIFDYSTRQFCRWDTVKSIANDLGLEHVPEINYTMPDLSINNVQEFITNLKSVYNEEYDAEGMIIRHKDDAAYERRWMAKIRRKDFR